MHTLIQGRPLRAVAIETLLPMLSALAIADAFFVWHSFARECVGFLATWYVVEVAWRWLLSRVRRSTAAQ